MFFWERARMNCGLWMMEPSGAVGGPPLEMAALQVQMQRWKIVSVASVRSGQLDDSFLALLCH